MAEQSARVSGKSSLGEALKYSAKHWQRLVRFLSDGCVRTVSNPVLHTNQPIVQDRKATLFAGHDGAAENLGAIASLIESCRLNALDRHAAQGQSAITTEAGPNRS